MNVADSSDDVQMAAQTGDIDSQGFQTGSRTALDLTDPRLRQPGCLGKLHLGHAQLLPDVGQLRAADGGEHSFAHAGASRHALCTVPLWICGAGLSLYVSPVR